MTAFLHSQRLAAGLTLAAFVLTTGAGPLAPTAWAAPSGSHHATLKAKQPKEAATRGGLEEALGPELAAGLEEPLDPRVVRRIGAATDFFQALETAVFVSSEPDVSFAQRLVATLQRVPDFGRLGAIPGMLTRAEITDATARVEQFLNGGIEPIGEEGLLRDEEQALAWAVPIFSAFRGRATANLSLDDNAILQSAARVARSARAEFIRPPMTPAAQQVLIARARILLDLPTIQQQHLGRRLADRLRQVYLAQFSKPSPSITVVVEAAVSHGKPILRYRLVLGPVVDELWKQLTDRDGIHLNDLATAVSQHPESAVDSELHFTVDVQHWRGGPTFRQQREASLKKSVRAVVQEVQAGRHPKPLQLFPAEFDAVANPILERARERDPSLYLVWTLLKPGSGEDPTHRLLVADARWYLEMFQPAFARQTRMLVEPGQAVGGDKTRVSVRAGDGMMFEGFIPLQLSQPVGNVTLAGAPSVNPESRTLNLTFRIVEAAPAPSRRRPGHAATVAPAGLPQVPLQGTDLEDAASATSMIREALTSTPERYSSQREGVQQHLLKARTLFDNPQLLALIRAHAESSRPVVEREHAIELMQLFVREGVPAALQAEVLQRFLRATWDLYWGLPITPGLHYVRVQVPAELLSDAFQHAPELKNDRGLQATIAEYRQALMQYAKTSDPQQHIVNYASTIIEGLGSETPDAALGTGSHAGLEERQEARIVAAMADQVNVLVDRWPGLMAAHRVAPTPTQYLVSTISRISGGMGAEISVLVDYLEGTPHPFRVVVVRHRTVGEEQLEIDRVIADFRTDRPGRLLPLFQEVLARQDVLDVIRELAGLEEGRPAVAVADPMAEVVQQATAPAIIVLGETVEEPIREAARVLQQRQQQLGMGQRIFVLPITRGGPEWVTAVELFRRREVTPFLYAASQDEAMRQFLAQLGGIGIPTHALRPEPPSPDLVVFLTQLLGNLGVSAEALTPEFWRALWTAVGLEEAA